MTWRRILLLWLPLALSVQLMIGVISEALFAWRKARPIVGYT